MWQRWLRIAPALLALTLSYLGGCSKNPVSPHDVGRWSAPETELTYAPVESTTTLFRVHVYWYGYDRDGEVVRYRFAIDADTSKTFSSWRATTAHDSIFTLTVAPGALVGGHMFWIVAEDDQGHIDPTPAKRFFSVRTQPPTAWFTSGPDNFQLTGLDVKFGWTGTDPDGGHYLNPTLPDSLVRPSAPDAFEYLMLWPGRSIVEGHPELPAFETATYARLINEAKGSTLLPPHDDWKWTRTSDQAHVFTSLPIGQTVVVAIRAVDIAGAQDTLLTFHRNIRTFTVRTPPPIQPYPTLYMTGELFWPGIVSHDSIPTTVVAGEILEGNAARFSWRADPGGLGTPIAGYSAAVDDTTGTAWHSIDFRPTSATLTNLLPGPHSLFVRVVDNVGRTVLAVVQLNVIHPAFRDPSSPRSALYVDDFAAPPGDWWSAVRGAPNYPTDDFENAWWNRTLLSPLAQEFGYTFEQFDAVYLSLSDGFRAAPSLEELARHRVVIWSVDVNNTIWNPVALWRTLEVQGRSALVQYVRGGGTLIVTGFKVASSASLVPDLPNRSFALGMCASMTPGSQSWNGESFVRDYMGIDGAKSNDVSSRAAGARDFVEAHATPEGNAFGFQAAAVDTGSGAKWDPYAYSPDVSPDALLSPGLPWIEGWKLETALGCHPDESAYRRENPALPIASPIFTYHGVNEGVLQDGGPSPHEGLVVGIATQAHDDATGDHSPVTTGNAQGVVGRMVFLGFPIYYMKDAEAYAVMRAAFAYVNGSPTLPGGTP